MDELCEACYKRANGWWVIDDNAEVTLCRACVKALREQGEKVDKITTS